MAYVGSSSASMEYNTLLQSLLEKEIGLPARRTGSHCLKSSPPHPPSPFDESFLSFLVALLSLPMEVWKNYLQRQPVDKEVEMIPVNPHVQLFRTQMEALKPFADMSTEQRSHVAVSIAVPPWLTGTDEACEIIEAAELVFGEVLHLARTPWASYTAMGYELCTIDYEAFDCNGPGRIMTIEFRNDLATMSLARTPMLLWAQGPLIFTVSKGLIEDDLVQWINLFVDTEKPDLVMITGPSADAAYHHDAVLQSRAAPRLINQTSTFTDQVVAMGAAQETKNTLESQGEDCSEPDKCTKIRREPDRIAGKYKPPRPATWPDVASERHVHDEL